MKKINIMTVCIFWVLAFSFTSLASPAAELGKWWKNSEAVEALDLSYEQIDRIEKSYLDHRHELSFLLGGLLALEDLLESAMKTEPLDEDKILKLTESVAEARKELELGQASMMLDIRKHLTAGQWSKLKEMMVMKDAWILPEYDTDALNNAGDDTVYDSDDKGIKMPVVVYMPKPPYTDEAREANAGGLVVLRAVVRKDGRVDSFEVLQSVGYGLDESAIRTISKEWKFAPGRLNGKPVDTLVNIEVSFARY